MPKSKISRAEPSDYKIETVSVSDLMESTYEFIKTFFKGSMRVSEKCKNLGYIEVSASGTVYLIKLILLEFYSKSEIRAELTSDNDSLSISVNYGSQKLDVEKLERIAKLSGFDILEKEEGKIVFSITSRRSARYSIYSKTVKKFYVLLAESFFL